jgi:hypothetical protein
MEQPTQAAAEHRLHRKWKPVQQPQHGEKDSSAQRLRPVLLFVLVLGAASFGFGFARAAEPWWVVDQGVGPAERGFL